MEIEKLLKTPYKPSTNGTVERYHRTLNSVLGKVVMESRRDWDECLPSVMAANRASVHEATGFSPNRLLMGREVRMPLDLAMGLPLDINDEERSAVGYIRDIQDRTMRCYDIARQHMRAAAKGGRRHMTFVSRKLTLLSGNGSGIGTQDDFGADRQSGRTSVLVRF